MRRLLSIVALLYSLATAAGESKTHYNDLFTEGNKQYTEGEYVESIKTYSGIVDAGYASPALYFNLGNAYFKANNVPSSILFYERAKRLSPGDEDIYFNLIMANQQVVDKIEPVEQLFYHQWWQALVASASADKWGHIAWISLLMALVGFALFLVGRSSAFRKLTFVVGIAFVSICLLAVTCATKQKLALTGGQEAIVFSPSVSVLSSPDKTGTKLFVLHEGTKVEVLESVEEWRKISLADGNVGWLTGQDIQAI